MADVEPPEQTDRCDALLASMRALAHATGKTVTIGAYPHRDDYFCHLDGVEWQGSTPEQAVESVRTEIIKRSRTEVLSAQRTIEKDIFLRNALGITNE